MPFTNELRFLWKLVWDPEKNSKRQLDFMGALKLYYTLAIFAFIAYAVVGSIVVALEGATTAMHPVVSATVAVATSIGYFAVIGGGLLFFLVALPIGIAVDAIFYQIIAKFFLRIWNGGYDRTFTALVYAVFPLLLLYWLSPIPFINSLFIVIVPIWIIVTLVISLSVQQKVSRLHAMLAVILKCCLTTLVLLLLGFAVFSALAYVIGSVVHTGIAAFPWNSSAFNWTMMHNSTVPGIP